MDITTILNKNRSAVAVAAEAQLQHHLAQASHIKSRSPSEMGSEHDHPGQHSEQYQHNHHPIQLPNISQYHSPLQGSLHASMIRGDYTSSGQDNMFRNVPTSTSGPGRGSGEPAPKSFHCQTCGKGFARRSDLARHGNY